MPKTPEKKSKGVTAPEASNSPEVALPHASVPRTAEVAYLKKILAKQERNKVTQIVEYKGLPGSGLTTLLEQIKAKFTAQGTIVTSLQVNSAIEAGIDGQQVQPTIRPEELIALLAQQIFNQAPSELQTKMQPKLEALRGLVIAFIDTYPSYQDSYQEDIRANLQAEGSILWITELRQIVKSFQTFAEIYTTSSENAKILFLFDELQKLASYKLFAQIEGIVLLSLTQIENTTQVVTSTRGLSWRSAETKRRVSATEITYFTNAQIALVLKESGIQEADLTELTELVSSMTMGFPAAVMTAVEVIQLRTGKVTTQNAYHEVIDGLTLEQEIVRALYDTVIIKTLLAGKVESMSSALFAVFELANHLRIFDAGILQRATSHTPHVEILFQEMKQTGLLSWAEGLYTVPFIMRHIAEQHGMLINKSQFLRAHAAGLEAYAETAQSIANNPETAAGSFRKEALIVLLREVYYQYICLQAGGGTHDLQNICIEVIEPFALKMNWGIPILHALDDSIAQVAGDEEISKLEKQLQLPQTFATVIEELKLRFAQRNLRE